MTLADRVGVDVGVRLSVEDAIEWAGSHDVPHVDVRLGERLATGVSEDEAREIREACEVHGVELGLHTLSAVNMAEKTPFVDDATDEYLRAYVDAAARLDAGWVIVHGGYHFTHDVDERVEAGVERLRGGLEYAADRDVDLLLENHNPEPEAAEVHYVPTSPDECEQFFDALPESNLSWAFNPPHANLHPAGVEGFADELDLGRCREVRLNDNRGTHEEHLPIGEGTIDFAGLLDRLEADGYEGPITLAYGDLDAMLAGRERLAEIDARR
jgi:sugar phosphate isomerase/epimerase